MPTASPLAGLSLFLAYVEDHPSLSKEHKEGILGAIANGAIPDNLRPVIEQVLAEMVDDMTAQLHVAERTLAETEQAMIDEEAAIEAPMETATAEYEKDLVAVTAEFQTEATRIENKTFGDIEHSGREVEGEEIQALKKFLKNKH